MTNTSVFTQKTQQKKKKKNVRQEITSAGKLS